MGTKKLLGSASRPLSELKQPGSKSFALTINLPRSASKTDLKDDSILVDGDAATITFRLDFIDLRI